MCDLTIVRVGQRYGVYSFTTGVTFRRELTLLEWAKKDFDACFNYLFKHGLDEVAEELFEHLTRDVR